VIAFRAGSVAEILDDGLTGFVVDSVEEAVDAVNRLDTIDRRTCRLTFDERFTVARMAAEYIDLYRYVIMNRDSIAGLSESPCNPSYV
jgi:glycosyltransferase involved in cell wall biosynthesis